MLRILIGRAKSGKSDRLLQCIAELGDSSSQILLVPEHASHLAEVDLCRACGATVSRHAEVLSFRRLADRVQAVTGGSANVALDNGGKLLTLQDALIKLSPVLQVYRRPSQKPAFLQQLMDLFDEFRCYGVTADTLAKAAGEIKGVTGEKLGDLSLLYGAYEARLCKDGLDARDHMTKLCENLEESGYIDGKDIFIDGFTYFTAQERTALKIMLRRAKSVTVALMGEPNSREDIFRAARVTEARLMRMAAEVGCECREEVLRREGDTALHHLERCFFGEDIPWCGDSGAIRLRQAETVYSEVEQTAADILRLVAAGKCRFRDITVAARNMGEYTTVIETVFERYGIPAYISRRSDILEKPVLSLLAGVLDAVNNGCEYEDMFRWLKTGLAGLTPDECDKLENYVLKWDIRGKMWLQEEDWTENPDGYGAVWNENKQAELNEVNALRLRVQTILKPLSDGLKQSETAVEKVNLLYSFVEQINLRSMLEQQMRSQAEQGRMQLAEETSQLWDILCSVLDQFVEILGEDPMDLDTFTRLFRQMMTQYSVGTIPVSLDQVSVSETTRNDRHTIRYLFLLGVNDHVIPAVGQSGGILTEDDRTALQQQDIELAPGGMDLVAMELHDLYAILAQPTDGLVVSYPVTDVSGSELRPAFVIDRIQRLFPDVRIETESVDKEYRITAAQPALECAGTRRGEELWKFFEKEGAYSAHLAAMERAAAMKRGRLSPKAVRSLYGESFNMSASRAERLRSCHFAYFMEYGLRAKPRTPASFDAPQIGTFLHFLLEHVTREVMARGGFGKVDRAALHDLVREYTERYKEKELKNFENKSSRFQYLFKRLRSAAYAIVDQVAEEQRCSDFIPVAFELGFGAGKELPSVVISDMGNTMRLSGKVDRVDGWVKDNKLYIRVVDYKSGRKAFDLGAVQMGLDIQMLLYLFTLQKEGKAYFEREIEPAGVLYFPARDDIFKAERTITPEELQAMREKEMRRSGLLLLEPDVLQAMEHEALENPRFLPLQIKRDGRLQGSIASAAQLGKLAKHVERQFREILRELSSGNIDADPCGKTEEEIPCRYCPWASACHFGGSAGEDRIRLIPAVKSEAFWERLDKEEEEWQ